MKPSFVPALFVFLPLASAYAENRSYNGAGNSTGDRGAAGKPFIRIAFADYADGTSSLAGSLRSDARTISNTLSIQSTSEPNSRHGSDFIWQWGQFVDHDITLTHADTGESANIPVINSADILYNESTPFIPLTRSTYQDDLSNIRQQINSITSFVDASNVYGSDKTTATALRVFEGGCMKTDAQGLLPFNSSSLPMATIGLVPDGELRMAGDIRANEQPGLTALHTLFVQEHNRLAGEIRTASPMLTDEEIYQRARKINGAIIQSITWNEWLPALLGSHAPDASSFTYDSAIDPTISNEFATALFRFGHTMVSPQLMRIQPDSHLDTTASIDLMTAFFNPATIQSPEDYKYLLKGLACQLHQDADARIVSQLRNTLFGPAGSGGMDLAALNIQRGRDHGLPDYNTVRAAYGLTPATTWADISSDPIVQSAYGQVYTDIDDIDLWNTALSEDKLPGAAVGETLATAIAAEFTRIARGDAFFYLWDDDLSPALRTEITTTSLAKVISRNTGLPIQPNAFFLPSSDLAFDQLHHDSSTGLELNFMGEPGYSYQVNYGSTPADMSNALFPTPINTGDATYMMQTFDTDAPNATKRFYRICRTPIAN